MHRHVTTYRHHPLQNNFKNPNYFLECDFTYFLIKLTSNLVQRKKKLRQLDGVRLNLDYNANGWSSMKFVAILNELIDDGLNKQIFPLILSLHLCSSLSFLPLSFPFSYNYLVLITMINLDLDMIFIFTNVHMMLRLWRI